MTSVVKKMKNQKGEEKQETDRWGKHMLTCFSWISFSRSFMASSISCFIDTWTTNSFSTSYKWTRHTHTHTLLLHPKRLRRLCLFHTHFTQSDLSELTLLLQLSLSLVVHLIQTLSRLSVGVSLHRHIALGYLQWIHARRRTYLIILSLCWFLEKSSLLFQLKLNFIRCFIKGWIHFTLYFEWEWWLPLDL